MAKQKRDFIWYMSKEFTINSEIKKRKKFIAPNFGVETHVHVFFFFFVSGEIQQRGVVLPFTPDIYRPVLNRLRAEGFESFETSKFL